MPDSARKNEVKQQKEIGFLDSHLYPAERDGYNVTTYVLLQFYFFTLCTDVYGRW
jgi:hypothetical protein